MERKRSDTVPRYDPEALRNDIERSKNNIKLFEEAIEKERKTIKEFKRFIKGIEQAEI